MCWYIWGVWKKGNLCVMLRNPYTESKKLKEKKANAAPGDFPPVNKETCSFGIWPRIKFVFLNIPAGSLNDTRAHDSSRPSRGASPCYFGPSTSCVHLCGGWDTQLTGLILTLAESQNSETMLLSWSASCSFTHLDAVSAQPLSGVSTDVRALAGRTFSHLLLTPVLSWSCFGSLCCREVNVRPSLTVPNPGSVFQCFQVSVTVRTLSRKAQSDGWPSATFSLLHQDSWSHHWGSWSRLPLLLRLSVSVQPQKKLNAINGRLIFLPEWMWIIVWIFGQTMAQLKNSVYFLPVFLSAHTSYMLLYSDAKLSLFLLMFEDMR